MRGMNRFPFRFLPASPAVTPPPPPPPPLWTTLTSGAAVWVRGVAFGQLPRLEHLYPQAVTAFGQPVTFAYRAQSEFPVLTGNLSESVTASALTV